MKPFFFVKQKFCLTVFLIRKKIRCTLKKIALVFERLIITVNLQNSRVCIDWRCAWNWFLCKSCTGSAVHLDFTGLWLNIFLCKTRLQPDNWCYYLCKKTQNRHIYNMQNMLPIIDTLCTIASLKVAKRPPKGGSSESYVVQSEPPVLFFFFFKCL